jgi:hypothetical protein
MDAREPRVRHRGFFLHSPDGEADTGEHENPEGLVVRVSLPAPSGRMKNGRSRVVPGTRFSGGRSHRTDAPAHDNGNPAIRSGSVTGSRQRAHLTR